MPLNNYLKSLAKQKRICPRCHQGMLEIIPLGRGERDYAEEICRLCGYGEYVFSPKSTWGGKDPDYDPSKPDDELSRYEEVQRELTFACMKRNRKLEESKQILHKKPTAPKTKIIIPRFGSND